MKLMKVLSPHDKTNGANPKLEPVAKPTYFDAHEVVFRPITKPVAHQVAYALKH